MAGISEQIICRLTGIAESESKHLPHWADKHFIESCIVPPLSGEHHVHCNIAVVAPVSAGKSTLFNSLCGYPILPVASKTTSSVPTYITRIQERSGECVTVYGIKREETESNGMKFTHFVRDSETKQVYSAENISREMYDALFEYAYYITHGVKLNEDVFQYMTTVENIAYFMKSTEKADILFNGMDADKYTVSREDYDLSYANPRHRLLLLLILLCVYVNQNDDMSQMDNYTKDVNLKRQALLQKYNFPVDSDYCVCLDWCNDDIPEDVTLIDLPGTGASTQDSETQSSHTGLVRGILTEADAIWVLCSDNGAVDTDLLYALQNAIEGDSRKNKVCIYNCKNHQPNNSGPVTDFLRKLPCLTGERCYVVDALAGEYKYIQNGVSALMTKTASDKRCNDYDDPTEQDMISKLLRLYSDDKKAYCTFTTSRDSSDKVVAVQDSNKRFTLDSFFKNALTDYTERLKYEVALLDVIRQTRFYAYIRDSLASSLGILESIDGKGGEIARAVNEALTEAQLQTINKYVVEISRTQAEVSVKLTSLGPTISERIKGQFNYCLDTLIEKVKGEWRTLEIEGHPNCLEANLFGNYKLRESHPNWSKFCNVRDATTNMISLASFNTATNVAEKEIREYNMLLTAFVSDLKNITHDFVNDYIRAFLVAYDQKRDEFCNVRGSEVTMQLYQNFNVTRTKLKKALEDKLNATDTLVCSTFEALIEPNGIFDTVCKENSKIFRDQFCTRILDQFRAFMYNTFSGVNYIGWVRDCMRPGDLQRILNNQFPTQKQAYRDELNQIIESIYGLQPGKSTPENGESLNFPVILSDKVLKFGQEQILTGAVPQLRQTHENIMSLVGLGTDILIDLTPLIAELRSSIDMWQLIGQEYVDLSNILIDSDVVNTQKLSEECRSRIADLVSETGE